MIPDGPRVLAGVTVREPRVSRARGCEVVVEGGQRLDPDTVVAREPISGEACWIDAASILGVSPPDLRYHMVKGTGDRVAAGDAVATCKGWMGLVLYVARSPVAGEIADVCPVTGRVAVITCERLFELPAGLAGTVAEVWPGRGVLVESTGVIVEGVFGAGGFAFGRLAAGRTGELAGRIISVEAIDGRQSIQSAADEKAVAVVCWSATNVDIAALGEPLPFIVVGGFGRRPTVGFAEALAVADGMWAAVNGISFPNSLFIPCDIEHSGCGRSPRSAARFPQEVRLTAGEYSGRSGLILDPPPGLRALPGGTITRAARVLLDGGLQVLAPVQNMEKTAPMMLPISTARCRSDP